MKVEVTELEGLYRQLAVEVPQNRFQEEMDKELEQLRLRVTLKGFRKGKAPMNMIKSNYGESVKSDVIDKLIKATYPEAISSQTLKVASPPQVTDLKIEDDGSFSYKAKVEVFPDIKKVVFDGIKLTTTDTEASDAEVDEFIETLRDRRAEMREVNRAATADDVVVLDMTKVKDPKLAVEQTDFPETTVDLSHSLTLKEFKENIPGMKAGEEKDIAVKYADDYSDSRLAGAEITYKARLKSVKEKILPEVDDAFAKASAEAETVLELRLKIREEIKRQKEESQNRSFKTQIITQMNEKNPVPVPESMIENYLHSVIEDLTRQKAEFKEDEIRKMYRPMGEQTIRWQILYHQLAEQEKIEVLPSDTEKVIGRMARQYKITSEKAKEAMLRSGRADDIRESLLEEKVLDLISGRAKKKPEKK
ncbi:MAG: trigger factor [candidate division Zixibacteria bacterium]|nr:trigger factor [candidate division Zixibacteria bacterium]